MSLYMISECPRGHRWMSDGTQDCPWCVLEKIRAAVDGYPDAHPLTGKLNEILGPVSNGGPMTSGVRYQSERSLARDDTGA